MKRIPYRIQTDGTKYRVQVDFGRIFSDWHRPLDNGIKPSEDSWDFSPNFFTEEAADNWVKKQYGEMAYRIREWRTV